MQQSSLASPRPSPNRRLASSRTPVLVEHHDVGGVAVRLTILPAGDGRWEAQLWANTLAIRQTFSSMQQATRILYDWLDLARTQARLDPPEERLEEEGGGRIP